MKSLRFVFALIIFATCSSAWAGNAWVGGTIQKILIHDDGSDGYPGSLFVTMSTPMVNTEAPTCMESSRNTEFAVDLSRGASKAQYALLVAAKMANKSIDVALNSDCLLTRALVRNISLSE